MCKNLKSDQNLETTENQNQEDFEQTDFGKYVMSGSNGNIDCCTAALRYGNAPFAQGMRDGDGEIIVVLNKRPPLKKRRSGKKF